MMNTNRIMEAVQCRLLFTISDIIFLFQDKTTSLSLVLSCPNSKTQLTDLVASESNAGYRQYQFLIFLILIESNSI